MVSTVSVFPWTPSSQNMEPLGNPGQFSLTPPLLGQPLSQDFTPIFRTRLLYDTVAVYETAHANPTP